MNETQNNLQRLRKDKGLSQSQLAKLSGVSVRMIQKYEINEKDINKAQCLTVYKLAKALGCKTENLLNL